MQTSPCAAFCYLYPFFLHNHFSLPPVVQSNLNHIVSSISVFPSFTPHKVRFVSGLVHQDTLLLLGDIHALGHMLSAPSIRALSYGWYKSPDVDYIIGFACCLQKKNAMSVVRLIEGNRSITSWERTVQVRVQYWVKICASFWTISLNLWLQCRGNRGQFWQGAIVYIYSWACVAVLSIYV